MNRLYPRSFLRLILIGFGLALLPIVFALGNAAINVQRLAEQSERAVREAAVATRASREMTETLTGMERALRQHLVLHERGLLDDYRRLRGEFVQAAQEYARLPLDEASRAGLQAMLEQERRLLDRLGEGAEVSPEDFSAIARQAHRILSSSSHLIDAEVEHLRTTALEAHSTLMWQLFAAIPVTLGIALWFRAIISSQLRQVDRAIRTIGRAEYSDGVTVTGPQDLAYLGRRLDWLRRRLAELEEQKNRFLRHVSHDLKTPLTAIREGAQLLGEGVSGPLSEQQKTIIDIIDQNSRRLQQLIEELINYQQAGFAAGSIDPQPVALDVVCTQVLRTHRLVAAARAIRFERKLAPVLVEGDADKLRVVLDNLVTNAIKYSPREGVIRVGLSVHEARAVLDVIDDGPGVAVEERERVFEPFFRGTRARRDTVKGSGLGLAIAKEYVLAHRGKIEIVEGGKGGHFRVVLPLNWEKKD
ncbi:MAG: Sensor histidine kinase GlrK [Rhodocyclaceae bacterium]|nr:MAG: HAMP domain-containing histidine kinase [Rhodocyclaceae bacterium]MBE7423970.1 HAMP domain-containing histidine kinase [Zoogloeaceae bacterium]MBV6407589.1 Sensor histidine kinase GlrK [Rhodocyclaceae bacterium]MCK6383289.1 HAMP domain-containing histidine kinase [Rhodocyclaceae bacterium]CAG0932783.1 two-component system, NtrC family, sensor histidine kinase GlrK [Rhodocyclaceae bacterium]